MSDTPYAPRICIDFDGVLHSYTSGWKGATEIPDALTEGALDFVNDLLDAGWEVVVCSTRAETQEGLDAIIEWLVANGVPIESDSECGISQITHGKPPALVYLDDRALRFDGAFPSLAQVEHAGIPWTKR